MRTRSFTLALRPKSRLLSIASAVLAASLCAAQAPANRIDDFSGRPRMIVLSDIGNEPDDQMSFVRFLIYSNEFDVEAMIASTSTWQRNITHPETMHALISAYGEVRSNLLLHAAGWHEARELDERVFTGQPAYGLAATGAGKASSGAAAIVRAVERDDPRPLWISIWGGANTLAQALIELRQAHPADLDRLIEKIRVYSISDQDDAGPWIRREFPGLFYIVKPSPPDSGEYFYATWTGISGDVLDRNCPGADTSLVTNAWLDANIRNKGPLGKLYPQFLYIMEGDTPAFLGLIDNGLNAFRRPDWGGWGGRYVYRQPYGETHAIWTQGGLPSGATSHDTVTGIDGKEYTSDQATVWRWRQAYQNDFSARMSWAIADYKHANHNPIVEVNGQAGTKPTMIEAEVGKTVLLDASRSSDPDGQKLHYHWFHYAEAGSADAHFAALTITGADSAQATVTPTAVCRPTRLDPAPKCTGTGVAHIILAVTDDGTPSLTTYRRVVLTVHGTH